MNMDRFIDSLFNGMDDYIFENVNDEYMSEADVSITPKINNIYTVRDELYPIIETVLSTSIGDMQFKKIVGNFLDRNSEKLHTSGPVYLIPFADIDKQQVFGLFKIQANFKKVQGKETNCSTSIDPIIKKIIDNIKATSGSSSDFKLLSNNQVLWVLYCCIRFYTLKKDKQGLNTALAIYALAVYPSVFSLFFKHGTDESVMQYTIDNLSEKFLIKRGEHIFGGLFLSIQHSYDFLRSSIITCLDSDVVRFIQRIRNDQKSMIKNVCDQYMKNYNAGNRVTLNKDNYDDVQLDTEVENNTTIVEMLTQNITNQMITNSLDIQRLTSAKEIAQISFSDCRFYMTKVLTSKYTTDISKFVHSILFMFLYIDHHNKQEINSANFLLWANELFRKTNSNNENIKTIKETLDKWGEETGIHAKFKRLGSRISYKRAIFFYFIFSIQYYNK